MTSLMVSMMAFVAGVQERMASEKGATGTEYALLVAFVALVLIVGATAFGGALSDWFDALALEVASWNTSP